VRGAGAGGGRVAARMAGAPLSSMDGLAFEVETAWPESLRDGDRTLVVAGGWAVDASGGAGRVTLRVSEAGGVAGAGTQREVEARRDYRPDLLSRPELAAFGLRAAGAGFWAEMPVAAEGARGPLEVVLEREDGRGGRTELRRATIPVPARGAVAADSGAAQRMANEPLAAHESPEVVICLATYKPNLALLEKQVASLRAQTLTDWVCIVRDDASAPELLEGIRRILAPDPRFRLVHGEKNLGFYRNFEEALRLVPAGARFVALCDQDDVWFPEKLEASVRAFTSDDTRLAYCDMRVVRGDGSVIAETFWGKRRNNYDSLETLLLANTVTGAASVFRRALLDLALPFPPKVGRAYHDHWLAICARATGRIAYVDRPLYDYVQHGQNVIGDIVRRDDVAVPSAEGAPPAPPRKERPRARGFVARWLVKRTNRMSRRYLAQYRQLHVVGEVAALRLAARGARVPRDLSLFPDRWRALPRLFLAALRVRLRGHTTMNHELKFAAGFIVSRVMLPIARALAR